MNLDQVFVSFQDFVGKTRNFSAGVVARFGREEGYTKHRKFGHKWNWIWKILFIDELLVISESRTLDFRTVTYLWMGGIRRIGKLKINGFVSQSVIYLSGGTQGSEF